MADSMLRNKSLEYAKDVVILCRDLKARRVESVLLSQFLRSSTSIGANVSEAQFAQGPRDFVSKLEIALKECNESCYWLELLHITNSITSEEFNTFYEKGVSIRRILISSVTTVKKRHITLFE